MDSAFWSGFELALTAGFITLAACAPAYAIRRILTGS